MSVLKKCIIFLFIATILSWGTVEAVSFVGSHKIIDSTEYQELKEEILKIKHENSLLKKEYQGIEGLHYLLEQKLKESRKEIELLRKKTAQETVKNKVVYLTFDDGPSNTTPRIIEILEQNNIKATFFVLGNYTDFGKEMYQKVFDGGHVIGNHTFSHNYQLYNCTEDFLEDFFKLENLIYEQVGIKPTAYRFPGGSNTSYGKKEVRGEIIETLSEKGYSYYDWHLSSGDATNPRPSSEQIYNNVVKKANKDQMIILFHDSHNNWATVDALPRIIEFLLEKGYRFDVIHNAPKISFLV